MGEDASDHNFFLELYKDSRSPAAQGHGLRIVDADGNLIGNIVGFFLGWFYFAAMESSPKQATLGKLALSMKVTSLQGERISFGKATGRYFGKILSALILLIGFLMIAFTEKKQGLHDMLAGTLVANK